MKKLIKKYLIPTIIVLAVAFGAMGANADIYNPTSGGGGTPISIGQVPITATVAATGGDYTTLGAAVTAVCAGGGGNIFVKDGTYVETGTITGCTSLRITLSQGATEQFNGSVVTTAFNAPSGSSRIIIEGGKWLQTQGTAQGTAFDMSNLSNTYIQNTRVEGFGIATLYNDTTSTTFYNSINNAQYFDDNNCVEYAGTQANSNSIDNLRCRPKAGGAGVGLTLIAARGITVKDSDFEPATGTGITGISIDGASREIEFLNNWVENNATGVLIANGANRIKFDVNSITSNLTADITNNAAAGAVVFSSTSRTGTTISNGVFNIPTAGNLAGFTVTQNDTTNNPSGGSITNAGTGSDLLINGTSTGLELEGQASGADNFTVASNGFITNTTAGTENLRLAFDGTHYMSFTVSSGGNITATSTGGSLFQFSNAVVSLNGATSIAFQSSATSTTSNFATATTGSGVTTAAGLLFGGASTINYRTILNGSASTSIGAGNSYGAFIIGSAPITTPSTGTNAVLANEVINPLGTVTVGGTTPTNTASLYINGASAAGTNNYALDIATGNTLFGGSALSNGVGGIGYTTGAGSTVIQATNKTTGVTINAFSGTITMNNAALSSATIASFTVTDSKMGANDVVDIEHDTGGTLGVYTIDPSNSTAGSFVVNVRNDGTVPLSEALVLRFVIIKGSVN